MSTARYGMLMAERRFDASAGRVARMGADESVDYGHEVVEQIQAKHQFSANLNVVQIADRMWRSLLEIQVR